MQYCRGCEVKFQSFLSAATLAQVPMSSENLRFQKRAVPNFSLFECSPLTGLHAAITLIREPLVHFSLFESIPLTGLSAAITLIRAPLVQCKYYCRFPDKSDACSTAGDVRLNFSLSYRLQPWLAPMSSANLRYSRLRSFLA